MWRVTSVGHSTQCSQVLWTHNIPLTEKTGVRNLSQTLSWLLTHYNFILLPPIFFFSLHLAGMVSKYLLKIDFCGENGDIFTERTENSFLIHPGECDINNGILGNAEEGRPGQDTVSFTLLLPSALLGRGFYPFWVPFCHKGAMEKAIINYNTVSCRG